MALGVAHPARVVLSLGLRVALRRNGRLAVVDALAARSGEGDAFSAAFRIPNFLQNVFGEGALSASFIPVYAKLLAQDDEKEAGRVANAVFGILALVTAVIVLLGVLATPYIVTAIAAGFEAERRELAIDLNDETWDQDPRVANLKDSPLAIRAQYHVEPTREAAEHKVYIGTVASDWLTSTPPHRWLPAMARHIT